MGEFGGGERGREEGGERELGQDGARVGRGDGGVFEGDGGAHECGEFGGGERGREEGGEREQGQDGARVGRGDGGVFEGDGGAHIWGTSVAVSGDGKRVVSGSEDKTVRVWDVETGECLKVMEGHTKARVRSVALSGDGN